MIHSFATETELFDIPRPPCRSAFGLTHASALRLDRRNSIGLFTNL